MRPTADQLKSWLANPQPTEDLLALIRRSPATPGLLAVVRRLVPDLTTLPATTYTLYREFEHTGERDGYQPVYYLKRSQLTRAVLELIAGDDSPAMLEVLHDRLWSICEETTWVLPAHEEQGPAFWDIHLTETRTTPLGAHTMLTREPDSIDLFAAETGAQLAETLHLLGDRIAPEVRQRVRQEVQRHIFRPYLAYARQHWWFKGALNWNGVCNGACALAFLYLEDDLTTRAEALTLALEGFEAYIATGFEADGGSIEGVGYWNYGLMYYTIVAELLRGMSGGAFDLLSQPKLRAIATYPVGMALSPGLFANFGDATEELIVASGIVQRLSERTGVESLRSLLFTIERIGEHGGFTTAKLPVILRHAAWWDGTTGGALPHEDFYLPDCRVVKLTGMAGDKRVALVATAGHNDGHHSQTDIGSFIYHIDGESLIPDAGRGLYNKAYFRQQRYDVVFNNSYAHNVPRFAAPGAPRHEGLQAPGPEFGGTQQFYGSIPAQSVTGGLDTAGRKYAVIDLHTAYDLPGLTLARRTLRLDTATGAVELTDAFAFDGAPLPVEEGFVTWHPVTLDGATAQIHGARSSLRLDVLEPAGAVFTVESLAEDCRANRRPETLQRLAVALSPGSTRFAMRLTPI